MTAESHDRPVLRPLQAARLVLRNRIAFAATVNNLGLNDRITPAQVAFYGERARGGCALIITEGLAVDPTGVPNETVPLAFDARLIPGFRRIAEAVHAEGALVLGQLWHAGRQALWNPGAQPWAPSALRDPYSGSTPHEMTEEDIARIIRAFASTALNLQHAGFDGVELHGAHGYLITQFLSPWSNHRSDRWGGSTLNRSRLLVELIRAIRTACGERFVIGVKLSVDEFVSEGLDLDRSREIVAHLVSTARPDYLAASQANFSPSLELHVPDMRFPDAPFAHLPHGIREVADGVPVMAVAKVPDLDAADRLLSNGVADIVGMSRPLIADAHLVAKGASGREARPCIYCNACWHLIHTHRPIACIYGVDEGNPPASRHRRVSVRRRLNVRVVGGGPAGLEVARSSAERGHLVRLREARPEVGGRLWFEARVAGRETVGRAARWLEREAERLGTEIVRSSRVTAAEIQTWDPDDVVIVAIGAEPVVEPLAGARSVVSLEQALEDLTRLASPIAVIDEIDDEPVYAAAEMLSDFGHRVSVVTPRQQLGRHVAYVNAIGMLRRLDAKSVSTHTFAQPMRVEDGVLIGRHPFSLRERPICEAATIVRAGPYRSRPLEVPAGHRSIVVGDASSPRALGPVMREATATAASLCRSTSVRRSRARGA